jgi:hypothetical protein
MVAIMIEKTGSSRMGRLITKSRNQPNITAKIMEPNNPNKNVHMVGTPRLPVKVWMRKKLT